MSDLEYSVADGIATILLNRPEKKNAFNLDMIHDWAAAVDAAAADEGVRVLVVTGAGTAFCAGADLGYLESEAAAPQSALLRKGRLTDHIHRVALAVSRCDKPTIAAVNGPAVGAGMDMALMCDIRLAARRARFSEAYINVGVVPGNGGCYFLPRLVGMGRALELLLTGDFIDADNAERIGLVNRVVDDDKLMDETMGLATKLASKAPIALRMIKRATYQTAQTDLPTALDLLSSHFGVVSTMSDHQEALAASRERRPPRFTGA